jgi:predicted ATPase
MTNKANAFKTLDTFADSRVTLITGMQKAGYATVEECRPIVIEWACIKTGAEYRWNKDKTKVMLVTSSTNYEGAKTVVRDIMLMIEGTTRRASSAKKEPADPVAKIIEAFGKLTPAQQRKALAVLVA